MDPGEKHCRVPISGYATDIKDEAFLYMMLAARLAIKYSNLVFKKKAVTSRAKYIALKVLNYGKLTPSELAASIHVERHNITTLVRRMEKDGLITRKRDTQDERCVYISITDQGREALEQALIVAKSVHDKLMLSMSEDDAATLKRLSEIIIQNTDDDLNEID